MNPNVDDDFCRLQYYLFERWKVIGASDGEEVCIGSSFMLVVPLVTLVVVRVRSIVSRVSVARC